MLPGTDIIGGSLREIKRGEKVVRETLLYPASFSLALFLKGLWVGFLLSSGKDKPG